MTYQHLTHELGFQTVSKACSTVGNVFVNAPKTVRMWRERRYLRRELRRLLRVGPYIIDDMGLDLDDVRDEADKPFWRG